MPTSRAATVIVAAVIGIGGSMAGGRAAGGADGTGWDGREAVRGEHRLWGQLIVRVPLGRGHLAALTSQVDRIWAPYGVTLDWRDGPPSALARDGYSGWIRVLIDRNATASVLRGPSQRAAIAALHMPGGVARNVIYVSLDGAHLAPA